MDICKYCKNKHHKLLKIGDCWKKKNSEDKCSEFEIPTSFHCSRLGKKIDVSTCIKLWKEGKCKNCRIGKFYATYIEKQKEGRKMKTTKTEKKTKKIEKALKVWSNTIERVNCKTKAGKAALLHTKYIIEDISQNLKERKGAKGKRRWLKEIRTSYYIGIIVGMGILLNEIPEAETTDEKEENKRVSKFLKAISSKIKGNTFKDVLF